MAGNHSRGPGPLKSAGWPVAWHLRCAPSLRHARVRLGPYMQPRCTAPVYRHRTISATVQIASIAELCCNCCAIGFARPAVAKRDRFLLRELPCACCCCSCCCCCLVDREGEGGHPHWPGGGDSGAGTSAAIEGRTQRTHTPRGAHPPTRAAGGGIGRRRTAGRRVWPRTVFRAQFDPRPCRRLTTGMK